MFEYNRLTNSANPSHSIVSVALFRKVRRFGTNYAWFEATKETAWLTKDDYIKEA
jgi:hypothetical protein